MKSTLRTLLPLCGLCLSLLPISHAAVVVPADWAYVPPDVGPGDTFQLIFVTEGKYNRDNIDGVNDGADNSVIADWNAIVNTAMDNAGGWVGFDPGTLNWSAVVSVEEPSSNINARDNALVEGPVFLLNNTKIADDFADMWDGSIDASININENGAAINQSGGSGAGRLVWTGSLSSGFLYSTYPGSDNSSPTNAMGTGDVPDGGNNAGWIQNTTAERRGPDTSLRIYGLSEELQVSQYYAPEPGTAGLLFGGVLMLRALRSRRRSSGE